MKLITILCFLAGLAFAQQETIKIWPDQVPGAINDPDFKTKIFYVDENTPRIYRVTDPTLDIYPAAADQATGTAIIICPGGGYRRLAADKEGRDVALWLNKQGISAFILKYRLPSDTIMTDKSIGPLQDAQEAVRIVRHNAGKWHIKPDKIGIMGFSAGGHLASTLSTHFNEDVYTPVDTTSARPDFSILIYPVISMDTTIAHRGSHDRLLGKKPAAELVTRFSNELQVSQNTPPTFLVHAKNDDTVPVENSIRYFLALKKFNVAAEMHIFEKGGHGFGMAVHSTGTESIWPQLCLKWLKTKGF